MVVCPFDITYCSYAECPFKDCERHWTRVKGFPPGTQISVADIAKICRRYIGWLVEHAKEENDGSSTKSE